MIAGGSVARERCGGQAVANHFVRYVKMVEIGSGTEQVIGENQLSLIWNRPGKLASPCQSTSTSATPCASPSACSESAQADFAAARHLAANEFAGPGHAYVNLLPSPESFALRQSGTPLPRTGEGLGVGATCGQIAFPARRG